MRHIVSSASAKAIWLDRDQILKDLIAIAKEAKDEFLEIRDIRLFGSLAKNEATGLSDIDIFIIAETKETNPFKKIKPYFDFFSRRLKIAVDVIVAQPEEIANFEPILKDSFSLLFDLQ